jgi:hypothetical protein
MLRCTQRERIKITDLDHFYRGILEKYFYRPVSV